MDLSLLTDGGEKHCDPSAKNKTENNTFSHVCMLLGKKHNYICAERETLIYYHIIVRHGELLLSFVTSLCCCKGYNRNCIYKVISDIQISTG